MSAPFFSVLNTVPTSPPNSSLTDLEDLKISPKEAPVIIKVASVSEWEEKNLIIKEKASDDSGDELLIYFEDMAQLRKAIYKVNRKKIKDLGF